MDTNKGILQTLAVNRNLAISWAVSEQYLWST